MRPHANRPRHPHDTPQIPLKGSPGATLSPVMAAIFVGLVLTILVFTGIAHRLGDSAFLSWAYAGAAVAIGLALLGVYRLLRLIQKRRVAAGRRDPLLLRRLMEAELEATSAPLRKRLDNPDLTVEAVFDQLLQDQIEALFTTDVLRFTELRRKFEKSGIDKQTGSGFRRFFGSPETDPETELPEALQLMERAVAKRHDEGLAEGLVRLKAAHQTLHTFMGDYLNLLPCAPDEIVKLQKRYPFRPPDDRLAREMLFAGRFLNHLLRKRAGENGPRAVPDTAALAAAAKERVPGLSAALAAYETTWRELLDLYDQRY
ncbi:MAG: hypothetical protein QNJ22_07195 [Desulfosarcinaceae bacterium]|nr:hypothetical protein [Desulfosarcinaceae bacterium]